MLAVNDEDRCLHHLIEQQAQRTPDQVAIVFEQQRLTYRELDARAGQLAAYLRGLNVGPDSLVGLCVERSLEMVIGILGILKAGAAYVPMDATYPPDRIAYMLGDAQVKILLTQQSLVAGLPSTDAQVVCLDSFDWTQPPAAVAQGAPVRPDNLAYVIYTSGSTGRPKGVCIEHGSIVNYVLGVTERLQLEPGMQHATVSTIAADLGNTVVFPALVSGGCLHVISQERTESQALLSEYFVRERIDVLKIVPSHFAALSSGQDAARVMPRKRLILGGEASRLDWVEQLRALAPACVIYNHYGPTETTVGALAYRVGRDLPQTLSGTLPLGTPLPNAFVHVVDDAGQPVALGEQGELYIGGHGVARGYLNRPDLTAERFVTDPFGSGERLYRTGDVVRRLADGTLEFCGRTDDQVKLNGYRVELGEIEAALRDYRGVREAVVRLRDGQLVGYVVPRRAKQTLWSWPMVHVLPDGSPVAHLNRNETDYIYNEIFVLQAYLRHGVEIKDGDCILDAGANIGLFTVFASRLASNLRIISFEPNPAAFACLQANATAWGSTVTCLPVGVSSEENTAELTFFEGMSLLSGFHADAATEHDVVKRYVLNQQGGEEESALPPDLDEVIDDRLRASAVTAQLRTLSSVIAEHRLERIDLLKINVEKSELEVLEGLAPSDWPKIRQMVIEVDLRENVDPIVVLLEGHGFEVLVEQDPLLRDTALCYVYAIRPPVLPRDTRLIREQPAMAAPITLPADGDVLTPAALRRFLRSRLPRYMVPTAFVLLDKLPLTPNGKVDRQALPAPSSEGTSSGGAPVAPVTRPLTETETAVAAIWKELLQVQSVGVDDDFFELGGHSLLAIKAVSRIRDVFGAELQTRTVFEHSTLGALSKVLADVTGSSDGARRIARRPGTGPWPLSFAQEQLWFLHQLAPASPAYNMADVIPLKGTYQATALKRAVEELARRHEILRTQFVERDGQPVQTVQPTVALDLVDVDLSVFPQAQRDAEWRRVVQDSGRRPFDLSRAPLFRGTVVHVGGQDVRLLLVIHHIVADEWSMELVHHELAALYDAFVRGKASPLTELPIQYADVAGWQRDWLHGDALRQEIGFWNAELKGAPTVLDLVTDKPRPVVQTFAGATEPFELSQETLDGLERLGHAEHATLFMVLEAAFATLLHRYTGQDDLLVGTPISGRTQSETEGLIGCFLNTIVLRSQLARDMSFRELLRQARERALSAYAHPELPLEHLVAALAPQRDASRTPLFQVLFVLHDADGVSQVSKVSGNRELETGTSKFDVTLMFSQTKHGLEGLIEYSTDLFEADSIRRMCGHLQTLLQAIVRDPDQRVWSLPLLTDVERRRLVEWNDTTVMFPARDARVYHLIEAQVERAPNRTAVVFEDEALTYSDLERRANQVAHHLRELGVGPDVLVGLLVERSVDMMVGLLGILKAGGAYVPLDPAFPAARLAHMVEDSGMRVLVTHRDLEGVLPVQPPAVVRLDSDRDAIARRPGTRPSGTGAGPSDLAYVLYTSGSTGKPKGVAVPHSALTNFLLSMQQAPGFTAADTLLAVTTLSFDIAGLELYLPLVCGGRVEIASREDALDPQQLMERMRRADCTVMQATPVTWRALVDAGWSGAERLKALCGGEALPPGLAEELLPRCAEVWNLYGPTETTIWSTAERVTSVEGRPVSIGRPIANTQVFVLDVHGNMIPAGLAGELYIGGAGVARGYLRRDELTRERFVPSPVSSGERLYRTGDLARWLSDGRLEWLGRTDQQVKVRGFRIEPGEIETVIARHPAVREVVVVAREDGPGESRLVAYLVAINPPVDLADQLRASVRSAAPEYMVPSEFVLLAALPRTLNGKVDRKALPAPETGEGGKRGAGRNGGPAAAPQTATEELVMNAFHGVLGSKDFGVSDSFFDLGGHSLMAARLMTQLRAVSGVDLPLRSLFERPTVAGLAQAIDAVRWSRRPAPQETVPEHEEIEL